jgi:UDP-N-acetylmuramate dehydrogenase
MPVDIRTAQGDRFSTFRTFHTIRRYCEVRSVDEIREAFELAAANGHCTYVLGGGSNTLFTSKRVNTFVIKNDLPTTITELGPGVIRVSSSVSVSTLLEYLYRHSLDGPYYLSALPATMGGVIAMNAGRGREHRQAISDFVVSVQFYHEGQLHDWTPMQYQAAYRDTAFLTMENAFIVSAVLRFSECAHDSNPIDSRRRWARRYQDLSAPNCGSAFCKYNGKILGLCSRMTRFWPARFSRHTGNWILNTAKSPFYLRSLVAFCLFAHRVLRQDVRLELRTVT